ncbi:MAG: phosphotransferase [Sarcina sp.]
MEIISKLYLSLYNIMIDNETGEGVAVIDLDTVMPGLSLYDFGDAIRSGANTALEDEGDLDKVSFDFNLFEEFTKGYLEEVKEYLTKREIELLGFSIKIITLELTMRFLGDYLNGDLYFKTQRKDHNLDRARNQLKLVKDIENNFEKVDAIIRKYS